MSLPLRTTDDTYAMTFQPRLLSPFWLPTKLRAQIPGLPVGHHFLDSFALGYMCKHFQREMRQFRYHMRIRNAITLIHGEISDSGF